MKKRYAESVKTPNSAQSVARTYRDTHTMLCSVGRNMILKSHDLKQRRLFLIFLRLISGI